MALRWGCRSKVSQVRWGLVLVKIDTIHIGGVAFILMPSIGENGHMGVKDQGCIQN